MPIDFNTLVSFFNAGRFADMEQAARQLVKKSSGAQSGLAWKALGVALKMQGKDALQAMQQAARLLPNDAEVQSNLGVTLREQGKLAEAIAQYRKALLLRPDFADVLGNMANALVTNEQPEEALAYSTRLMELAPGAAKSHQCAANVRCALGEYEVAVEHARHAVQLDPRFAEAWIVLGDAQQQLKKYDAAVHSYQQALALQPNSAQTLNNFGAVLTELGQIDEALRFIERSLALQPANAQAHNNLGNALRMQGRHQASIACFEKALALKPAYLPSLLNLGSALITMQQFSAAVESCHRTVTLHPQSAQAHINLGQALCQVGHIAKGIPHFEQARTIDPHNVAAFSYLLFWRNYLLQENRSANFAEASRFGELLSRSNPARTSWSNTAEPQRRLKVGFVSGDLRQHPVAYFLDSVLARLRDRHGESIAMTGFSNHPLSDSYTETLKSHCDTWHAVAHLSDVALAQLIIDEQIDILLDLSGHSGLNRLPVFALKPAPVQASWLGYFATTGLKTIDYIITDRDTATPAEQEYFTETFCYLSASRLCFTEPDTDIAVSALPALAQSGITFGCFNNLVKMGDEVIATWAAILQAVPSSRLFLKSAQLREATTREEVITAFSMHGIAASRLLLEADEPRAAYLAAYQRVDIALDPFPFTGGTTTIEALWMGVPVLTLAGDSFIARQGASLLSHAGQHDWIATSKNEYIARAVAHAQSLESLSQLRGRLRPQVLNSSLFDASRFAADFEHALRTIWKKWCASHPL